MFFYYYTYFTSNIGMIYIMTELVLISYSLQLTIEPDWLLDLNRSLDHSVTLQLSIELWRVRFLFTLYMVHHLFLILIMLLVKHLLQLIAS